MTVTPMTPWQAAIKEFMVVCDGCEREWAFGGLESYDQLTHRLRNGGWHVAVEDSRQVHLCCACRPPAPGSEAEVVQLRQDLAWALGVLEAALVDAPLRPVKGSEGHLVDVRLSLRMVEAVRRRLEETGG